LRTPFVTLALASLFASAISCDAQSSQLRLPQCLRFDQPLGYWSTPNGEPSDSSWYVIQLADSGVVRRVLRPAREREAWIRKNQWSLAHDTLRIRVADPPGVGWDVVLSERRGGHFTGMATYLTDVIVKGRVPVRMKVRATRIKCPALPA